MLGPVSIGHCHTNPGTFASYFGCRCDQPKFNSGSSGKAAQDDQAFVYLNEALIPSPELKATQSVGSAVTEVPLSVTILSPSENIVVEVGVVRVWGSTLPEMSVGINGVSVEVDPDGSFQRDFPLAEGINSIDVVASAPSGQVASRNVTVLFVPRVDGVPLSVLYPHGLEVNVPTITIVGATRQDAVVGIDGKGGQPHSNSGYRS